MIRFQQGFFQLAHYPFSCQGSQIHRFTQFYGFLCYYKVETGCKLPRTQHPQGILNKRCCIHMPENSLFQIFHSAKMINDFPGQNILHQCIHSKIPPACRLFCSQKRIYKYRKIFMSTSDCLFFSRHSNIHIIPFQPVNTEILSHLGSFSKTVQYTLQYSRRNSVNFNINIFIILPQQSVTDKSSHIVGSPAFLFHTGGNPLCHFYIFIFHYSIRLLFHTEFIITMSHLFFNADMFTIYHFHNLPFIDTYDKYW